MWFPFCFWDAENDTLGIVNRDENNRGKAFLFYSTANVSGGAVLTALMAGDAFAFHPE